MVRLRQRQHEEEEEQSQHHPHHEQEPSPESRKPEVTGTRARVVALQLPQLPGNHIGFTHVDATGI